MSTNAQAVANELLKLASEREHSFRILGLMKRIYIVHGFSLAMFDKPAFDENVEAWRLGPVVPSIYQKYKGVRGYIDIQPYNKDVETNFEDKDINQICLDVFNKYENQDDMELVGLTHAVGTPWWIKYKKGENVHIPNDLIQEYYRKLIE